MQKKKLKIPVSTLLTAVATGQIFHDAVPQRSCFSGQSLTSSVLKKLQGAAQVNLPFHVQPAVTFLSREFCSVFQYHSSLAAREDNFLQGKLLLGFISMTLGYLL